MFFHLLQHWIHFLDGGDAMFRIGGGAGRIQFVGQHGVAGGDLCGFTRVAVIGQVQHHHRLEIAAGRGRGQNALTIGFSLRQRHHRRFQVWHDQRSPELLGGVKHRVHQAVAIAQV